MGEEQVKESEEPVADDFIVASPDPAVIEQEAADKAFFASDLPPSAFRLPPSGESRYARLEGWERRYQAVLDATARQPYALGENDCFRLACAMLEALTGVDRWPEFAGQYKTYRESLVLLHQYGSSFDAAFDWFFGVPHCAPGYARRGDIVKVLDANGTAHLGVSTGTQVAVFREHGLSYEPRRV